MASIGSIINTALTSLQANQLGISVAGNNIANANNLNYTRQRLVTAPAVDFSGSGVGIGVEIMGVEAVRDNIIEKRLRQEDASKSGAQTLNQALSDIQVLFTDSDTSGLQKYLSDFFNSFQT